MPPDRNRPQRHRAPSPFARGSSDDEDDDTRDPGIWQTPYLAGQRYEGGRAGGRRDRDRRPTETHRQGVENTGRIVFPPCPNCERAGVTCVMSTNSRNCGLCNEQARRCRYNCRPARGHPTVDPIVLDREVGHTPFVAEGTRRYGRPPGSPRRTLPPVADAATTPMAPGRWPRRRDGVPVPPDVPPPGGRGGSGTGAGAGAGAGARESRVTADDTPEARDRAAYPAIRREVEERARRERLEAVAVADVGGDRARALRDQLADIQRRQQTLNDEAAATAAAMNTEGIAPLPQWAGPATPVAPATPTIWTAAGLLATPGAGPSTAPAAVRNYRGLEDDIDEDTVRRPRTTPRWRRRDRERAMDDLFRRLRTRDDPETPTRPARRRRGGTVAAAAGATGGAQETGGAAATGAGATPGAAGAAGPGAAATPALGAPIQLGAQVPVTPQGAAGGPLVTPRLGRPTPGSDATGAAARALRVQNIRNRVGQRASTPDDVPYRVGVNVPMPAGAITANFPGRDQIETSVLRERSRMEQEVRNSTGDFGLGHPGGQSTRDWDAFMMEGLNRARAVVTGARHALLVQESVSATAWNDLREGYRSQFQHEAVLAAHGRIFNEAALDRMGREQNPDYYADEGGSGSDSDSVQFLG